MAHREILDHWRKQRRAVVEKLAEARPWLRPVYWTDIWLIDGFIAYHEARLSRDRDKRY